MFGVVLTNRELSHGFAMLAGPLAHVIVVLVRHITYRKTLYLWDISYGYLCLGNRMVRVSMSDHFVARFRDSFMLLPKSLAYSSRVQVRGA